MTPFSEAIRSGSKGHGSPPHASTPPRLILAELLYAPSGDSLSHFLPIVSPAVGQGAAVRPDERRPRLQLSNKF